MGPHRSAVVYVVLLCVLALCCAAPALALEPAGDGWCWTSPQPQGQFLNAVDFGDGLNAWAVGDAGTIMHSYDAGVTWSRQAAPTDVALGSVVFTSALSGWAAGGDGWSSDTPRESSNGVILHTADGGVTWVAQKTPASAVSDLAFVDDQQGWAVGGRGLILHTTDGGQTWVAQRSGVTRNILSVVFTDTLHGYAGCSEGLLLTTTDGGASWKRARGSADYSGIVSLATGPDGKLWAALGGRSWSGSFARLAWTVNRGRTWRYADVSRMCSIWDVVANGSLLYAVGASDDNRRVSQALVSADGGATWTAHLTGTALLGGVASNGAGTLCAVGDITATSSDDGATWFGHSTRPALVGSPEMVGPSEAWAVSDFANVGLIGSELPATGDNALLHTTDGVRWAESFRTPDEFFAAVRFADAVNGWAVGARGLVRHTQDGGATWQQQASGTSADLTQLAAPTADAAWACGVDVSGKDPGGIMVRTTDGGTTWEPVTLPASVVPLAMTAVSSERACLVGVRLARKGITPVAVRTADGGATWSRVTLPFSEALLAIPLAVDFADADHGWLLALSITNSAPVVAATTDGGATWAMVASREDFGRDILVGVDFLDANEGWASGTGVYHTTDGGRTWKRQLSGHEEAYYSVGAHDSAHALATGSGLLSTFDVPGDTASPVTLCAAAGGWSRTEVVPTLSAADVGTSGLAWTEYSVDGGPWTRGSTPPPFLAPPDHSGDGAHRLHYRSADNAGNIEPEQALEVHIDTVKPVIHLRRSVVGRDGVLRMHLRINDKSCPSVDQFGFGIRTLKGRAIGGVGWDGMSLRTNRWVTLRDSMMGDFLTAGTYRVLFYAEDRAGNRQARIGRGLLIVKPHKVRRFGASPMSITHAGGRVTQGGGALWTGGARWQAEVKTPAAKLTTDLQQLVRSLTQQER
jgi:photosystem II stability/assembly factor-like uncharacterized protein